MEQTLIATKSWRQMIVDGEKPPRRRFRKRNLQARDELERGPPNDDLNDHLLQQSNDRFFPLNLTLDTLIGWQERRSKAIDDKFSSVEQSQHIGCENNKQERLSPIKANENIPKSSLKDLTNINNLNKMTQNQNQVINLLEEHHGRHRNCHHRGQVPRIAPATKPIIKMNSTLGRIPCTSSQRGPPTRQTQQPPTKPSSLANRIGTILVLALVLALARYQSNPLLTQVRCQQFSSESPSSTLLGVESRGAVGNMGPQQANGLRPLAPNSGSVNGNTALDQLVSFLNSINNQQQSASQTNNNQRRSPVQPLPLGAIGNQRQLAQPQPVSSTPVNPFLAAVNFQPTRRQQVPANVQFPQNQQQQQQPQNPFGSASSPPALTLNRIANQFSNNQQPQQQAPNLNIGQQQPGRFTNSQQLPMPQGNGGGGSFPNNQQQSRLLVPNRNFVRQQQANSGNNQFNPPLRSPLMPPPTATPTGGNQQQQPRPITGFAPSGPPPGSASNNAINVVQSPANAIGQQLSPIQMLTPFEMPLLSNASNRSTTTTTTTTTTAATTTTNEATSPKQTNPTTPATTTTTISTKPSSEDPPTTLTVISSSTSATSTSASSSSSSEQPSQTPATSAPNTSIGSSGSSSETTMTTTDSSWNPVQMQANRTRPTSSTSLAPSPDIVTVPPGYNPDQPTGPQNYDISVSAQMGGPSLSNSSPVVASIPSSPAVEPTPSLASQPSVLVAAAPTETTTIIWSSETQTSPSPVTSSSVQVSTARIQPTRILSSSHQQVGSTLSPTNAPTPPTRIRDVMVQNDEQQAGEGIVYGKAAGRSETKPNGQEGQQSGRPFIQTAQLDNQVRPYSAGSQPLLKSNHGSLPFKPSRPLNGGANGSSGGGGGGGSGMSVGSGFSIVGSGNQTMPTGDIQDYVANAPPPIVSLGGVQSPSLGNAEPTISAQGGPDPATFDLAPEASSSSSSSSSSSNSKQPDSPGSGFGMDTVSSSTPAPRLRRPTFKPKPAVPPIRIDSCIVGDDSSCDQSNNERCVTEYGISSCHCKPGFARLSQARGFCSPVSLLQFNMKIDKLSDDRKLVFNHSLENPNSEEYQYLEYETIQALAGAMQQTSLAKQFMGARINKFYERRNKVWANVSINLQLNNVTRNETGIQQLAQQELGRLVQQKQRQPLGESTIVLDGSRESVSKLVDVNECASKELNDCSKHASCINEFGGYSCQCLAGYEDKSQQQPSATSTSQLMQLTDEDRQASRPKQGRVCMGCSATYCSNRGDCSIVDGKKQCKCRANFIGARCDIDSEVLAVAIGGSLVGLVILIVTFWCLFVFNRRWRREQQKMDAMSATSGLTYNYVNSSNNSSNSLMSPALGRGQNHAQPMGGGVSGRSATNAYTMGQRFSSAGTGLSSRQYHADQQAIIGSTSSGSSAASQPIACNPYVTAAGYPYDEGLLIAPASTGSSEQTSPSANSYRGIMGASNSNHSAAMLAAVGNAYTLSGHHHHHGHHAHHHQHLLLQQQQQQQQQQMVAAHHMHHHHHHGASKQLSQFHPSALMDSYASRTLNTSTNNYCPTQQAANGYDSRWRTIQQADSSTTKQSSLAGYYLVR